MLRSLAQRGAGRATSGLQVGSAIAETQVMESQTACRCGAALPAEASWCPRCLEPRTRPLTQPMSPLPSPQPLPRAGRATTGRFAKSDVSFGLTGRIVVTVLLLLPLVGDLFLVTQLVGIGFLAVYGGVALPWALRDLWSHPKRRI
jgi:ribosomal protein L40E